MFQVRKIQIWKMEENINKEFLVGISVDVVFKLKLTDI